MPVDYSRAPVGATFHYENGLSRTVVDVSADRMGRIGVTYLDQDGRRRYCSWARFMEWKKDAACDLLVRGC